MLTEANVEAHNYRLEFAQELMGSFAKARRALSARHKARPEIEKATPPNFSIKPSPHLLSGRMAGIPVELLP